MPYLRRLAILALIFGFGTPVQGQFQFDKIKPRLGFEPNKLLTFYSNSHFNRVEGFYLNMGAKLRPRSAPGLTLFADGGYAFKNAAGRRWRYALEAQKVFDFANQLTVGGRYFNEVFSQDAWIISTAENSLAGLFDHNDFMDYVARKGWLAFADYKLNQLHTLRLELGNYRYDPLNILPNTDWSLFSRNKRYPLNPHGAPGYAFVAGRETSARAMAAFDFRDNPIFPIVGWYFEGIFERTFSDFETNGLFLTVKRFQPTTGSQRLKAKLLFGSRSGSFAYQHLIGLGGLGSLRGYEQKEFIGNRALFASLQYNFGGDVLQRLPLHFIPVWDALSLGVFLDSGYAWVADPANKNAGLFEFGGFSTSDLRTDFGFSLFFTEGLLRFDFARRTDRGGAGWQIYFRILDKF